MIKSYYSEEKIIATIIRKNYTYDGINFFTQDESSQQVAYMSHKKDTIIKAHIHPQEQRNIIGTPEVLIIKKGKVRLDLYSQEKEYIESTILEEGDIAVLPYGGHGLKCLEDIEMVEVKQGPYLGLKDKERFPEIEEAKVIIND